MNAYLNEFSKKKNTYLKSTAGCVDISQSNPAALPVSTAPARTKLADIIEKLLSLLDKVVGALAVSKAVYITRVSVSVLCFLAIVGIIGGIEGGVIGMGLGTAAAFVIVIVEVLCLFKCK